MKIISGLSALQELNLEYSSMPMDAFLILAPLKLKSLSVGAWGPVGWGNEHPSIDDSFFEHIANIVTLESFSLMSNHGVTDACLVHLGKLPNLRELEFDFVSTISKPAVDKMVARFKAEGKELRVSVTNDDM